MENIVLGGEVNPWNLVWRAWGLRLAVLADFLGDRNFVNASLRISAWHVNDRGRTPRCLHSRSISTVIPCSMNAQDFLTAIWIVF
jgi:hypothetical protein